MANKLSPDEWENLMRYRLEKIIDNSDSLLTDFQLQGDKDKKIAELHQTSNQFQNLNKEDFRVIAESLSDLIFATPLYNNYFYVNNDNEFGNKNEMFFFSSYDELKYYRSQNNNCPFLCLKIRDIINLFDYFNLEIITIHLTDYILNFTPKSIINFYKLYIYENINHSSSFILGEPAESYSKAISILTPIFNKVPELTNVWLFHVYELKNQSTEEEINNKNQEVSDIFVLDMTEPNFIMVRDIINKVIKKTNNHTVKVVLYDSDMGLFLTSEEHYPVYSKS